MRLFCGWDSYCPQRVPNIVDGPVLDALTDNIERTHEFVCFIEAWIYIVNDAVKGGSHVDWEYCSRGSSNRFCLYSIDYRAGGMGVHSTGPESIYI